MRHSFTVRKEDEGRTLHAFLRENGVSYSLITRLKADPGIFVNGEKANTDVRVRAGDTVCFNDTDRGTPSTVEPREGGLDVVWRDEGCMVIEKEAGMPCHPSFNHHSDTVANRFMGMEENRREGRIARIINRLDKDTSGLVMIALDSYSASRLRDCLKKEYTALVAGRPETPVGVIDLPISRREGSIITRRVSGDGQRAVTRYETIVSDGEKSLVRIVLETGRTHQIRVHFSHIGHPLLGDDLYGGDTSLIPRHALHCSKLTFLSEEGQRVEVESPLPPDMAQIVRNMKKKAD